MLRYFSGIRNIIDVIEKHENVTVNSSVNRQIFYDLRFPTMWYVQPVKPQIKYGQSDQSLC